MRKSQALIISTIFLIVVIMIGIAVFYFQVVSLQKGQDDFGALQSEGSHISTVLLGEAFPDDWNKDSVLKVGLVKDDTITDEVLLKFAEIDYPRTKILLGIQKEYLFFFTTQDEKDIEDIKIQNLPTPIIIGRDTQYFGWNGRNEGGNGGENLEDVLEILNSGSANIVKTEKLTVLDARIDGTDQLKPVRLVTLVWDFASGTVTESDSSFDFLAFLKTDKEIYSVGETVGITE
ncbi:hypothetical protein J4401_05670 [Candidatus Woesearchaeota archaeon]|nr:hypothetical protein [Candidatus Woesearchaeota archaeon]